jgi:hypothetical protein
VHLARDAKAVRAVPRENVGIDGERWLELG